MSFSPVDIRWMRRALDLAARGLGHVEPNPPVGCVLTDARGVLLAEGWHAIYGGFHAEAAALAEAEKHGIPVTGATAYVTLEPCAHHGKTPSCADALVNAGVARVVVAATDPFAKVDGKGLQRLREAGIQVEVGCLEAEALWQQQAFRLRCTEGRPQVILKWAQTLDGMVATSTGDSKWITSEAARADVHQWRARCDAIVVGVGTVLADDPSLTVRGVENPGRHPLRVIVDPMARTPVDATCLHDRQGLVWVAVSSGAPEDAVRSLRQSSAEVVVIDTHPKGGLDLAALFATLPDAADPDRGRASRIWVEGGSRLHGYALRQGVGDYARVYMAPNVLGDAEGVSAVRGAPCPEMQKAVRWQLKSKADIGADLVLEYAI